MKLKSFFRTNKGVTDLKTETSSSASRESNARTNVGTTAFAARTGFTNDRGAAAAQAYTSIKLKRLVRGSRGWGSPRLAHDTSRAMIPELLAAPWMASAMRPPILAAQSCRGGW